MRFTKTQYRHIRQCPKRLWLEAYRPELKEEEQFDEDKLEQLQELQGYAQDHFREALGVTVSPADQPAVPAQGEAVFGAAFQSGDLSCTVDILLGQDGGCRIYAIRSSTSVKNLHIQDLAFQKYVLEQLGLTVTGAWVLLLNPEYERVDALDTAKLFVQVDVTDAVEAELALIPGLIAEGRTVLASQADSWEMEIHEGCKKCPYWSHCTQALPKPSVFDLYKKDFNVKLKMFRSGQVALDQVVLPKPNGVQKAQLACLRERLPAYIDKAGIRDFLGKLSFPLYFLDFEAFQTPVPLYSSTKPFAHIPFQYSLHYVGSPDGELKHLEFLAEPGLDPRRAVAESLCRDIPMGSCVTAYNKTYEQTRLKELAALFPDLADHLKDIHDRLVDFEDPFVAGHYYLPAMGRSLSIKSVLPALYPNDPELDYHGLELVHNGTEAMSLYPKLPILPQAEREQSITALLKYCQLDTLGLVKVWQALRRAAE